MANQTSSAADIINVVKNAYDTNKPVSIIGGNSKAFMGRTISAEVLEMNSYSGVISYEPTELYITACAGTLLSEVESCLAEKNQMLVFEPPSYSAGTTIGGMIAAGISGARRPYAGSVRDNILGMRCVNGRGEDLEFGGQVIKNVAGYDVSRLMTGAYGTLGVILEASIRTAPRPEFETSVSIPISFDKALDSLNIWTAQSIPISAAVYDVDHLKLRLSGKENSVIKALKKISSEQIGALDQNYWRQLNNHQLDFFHHRDKPLWRLSLPALTSWLNLTGDWLIDWGGAQRWLKTELSAEQIRAEVTKYDGHATLVYSEDHSIEPFQPLPESLKKLHQQIKQAFDPKNILNPGRMYSGI